MLNLSEEQLGKCSPKAGVKVTRGVNTLPGISFVFVDSEPIAGRSCDRITRLIIGPDRDAVLRFRDQIGDPASDPPSALGTCFCGRGPTIVIDSAGNELENLLDQDLLIPETATITISGNEVKPPARVAFAPDEEDFAPLDQEKRLDLIQECEDL